MNQKKKYVQTVIALITMIILVLLDQWTKVLAVTKLKEQNAFVLIKDVLEFRYLENRGAAFSSLTGKTTFLLLFTAIIMLMMVWIYWKLPETKKWLPLRWVVVAVVAGGLGNFVDRVRLKYVVDFVYFKLIDFPTFNVADCYVTVSVLVLFILLLFRYKDADWEELKDGFPKWMQGKTKDKNKDLNKND